MQVHAVLLKLIAKAIRTGNHMALENAAYEMEKKLRATGEWSE
jgi:hypothetical protein